MGAYAAFDGFSELRAEHTLLLREYHATGGTKDLIEKVLVFIQRGCQSGEILDGDDEREGAQRTLDHWATLLYRMSGSAPDATLTDFDSAKLPILRDEDCPYLGLNSFGEEQHACFFGRERLLERCVEVLLKVRMLSVIGQSGSGKSSLVSGGLVPALKSAEFSQLPESPSWIYVGPVFPGSEPAESLLEALLPSFTTHQSPEHLKSELRQDSSLLSTLLGQKRAMVLVVDQFEETFTLCENDSSSASFLNLLIEFVKPPESFRRIIITMRSEFETWAARNPEFYQLFSTGQIRMLPMDQDELRRAIEMPAVAVGLKFESGVVDALIHDTLGEPAALPMLQFSLLKLWQTRQHNRILQTAYAQLGGARLALAKCANEFFLRLAPENQITARRILLRMVRIGDGLEVHSQRIKLVSLYETGEDPNRIDYVVSELAKAHLVRITAQGTPVAQIEVAHEALIRNWPTLLEWIQQKRTDLLTRRRLNEYAAEWIRRNRSDAALIDAEILLESERWIKTDAAREFGYHDALPDLIRASRAKQTAELERTAREIEAKQKANLLLTLGLFLGSSIVLALALFAYFNSRALSKRLAHQERELESKRLQIKKLTDEVDGKEQQLKRNKADFEDTKKTTQEVLTKAERDLDDRTKQSEAKEDELKKEQDTVDYLMKKLQPLQPGIKLAAPISTMGARVLTFFADHTQQQQAEVASAALSEVGYATSKPRDVEAHAPEVSEVRFFRFPKDKAEADFISQLLACFDSNMRPTYIYDAEIAKYPKPFFEVWFSHKAFSPDTSSARPRIARIFIHDEPQSNNRAKVLKERLEEFGYWAAVSEHSALEATEAKLRYFKVFPDDEREAEQLVELLKKLGISPIVEKPVVIDLPTESRPRHFELLLP
jgi:hypothetical protein